MVTADPVLELAVLLVIFVALLVLPRMMGAGRETVLHRRRFSQRHARGPSRVRSIHAHQHHHAA